MSQRTELDQILDNVVIKGQDFLDTVGRYIDAIGQFEGWLNSNQQQGQGQGKAGGPLESPDDEAWGTSPVKPDYYAIRDAEDFRFVNTLLYAQLLNSTNNRPIFSRANGFDERVYGNLDQAWIRATESGLASQAEMLLFGIEINRLLQMGDFDFEAIANLMTQEFGFESITWDSLNTAADINSIDASSNLLSFLTTSSHVIAYFDEQNKLQGHSSALSGIQIYRTYFGENFGGQGRVRVVLGSTSVPRVNEDDPNSLRDPYKGRVPLPTTGEQGDRLGTDSEFYEIHLGRLMNIAAMTHELGHQLDRFYRLAITDTIEPLRSVSIGLTGVEPLASYLASYEYAGQNTELFMNRPLEMIISRASSQDDPPEVFADMFMNAVLSEYGNLGYNTGWQNTPTGEAAGLAFAEYLLSLLNNQDATNIIQGLYP